jgi:signal transduction histidine kinase/ActR/RegA family two-component response regulator
MATKRTASDSEPGGLDHTDELERALADLREANERLVTAGVRMQELADEARRALAEAEAANQAKDEFLAALSHELRTPLNVILGWTHMLRRTSMTGAAADRAIDIIERNAKLQSQLIADLLHVSQIITGKLRLEVEAVDLAPLLSAAADALRPAVNAKAITLESHIEPGVRQVKADATRVQQIIWNVLSNAIKFTPQEGHVDLTLKQNGSVAEISIKDSGVGIEPDLLPHIFERFRQGDGSSHRAFGGLGLGLAIVRQLMDLHGGTVRAESSGAGCGSTFTLSFPILASTASRAQIERVDDTPSLRGRRVLVVEDEPDSRDLMVALLGGNGAEVTAASSVREALAQIHGHVPDVMIANIGLPDQDGYELIRQVRRLEKAGRHTSMPAVALTAYVQPQDRDLALAAGFQLHIAKPINPTEFVELVAGLMRRSRDRRG